MAHAWINIVYMKDEDFKAEQEKRRAGTTHRRPCRSSSGYYPDRASPGSRHERTDRRREPGDAGLLGRTAAIGSDHRDVAVVDVAPHRPQPLHHERAGALQGRRLADHLEVGRHAGAPRLGGALGRQVRSAADAGPPHGVRAGACSPIAATPSKIFSISAWRTCRRRNGRPSTPAFSSCARSSPSKTDPVTRPDTFTTNRRI